MKLENSRMRSEFSSFAIFLDTAISEPAPTAMLLIFPHPKFKPASNHFNNTKTKRMHTSDIYLFNKQIFCFLFCIFRYRRVQRPDFQWNRVYLTIKKKENKLARMTKTAVLSHESKRNRIITVCISWFFMQPIHMHRNNCNPTHTLLSAKALIRSKSTIQSYFWEQACSKQTCFSLWNFW